MLQCFINVGQWFFSLKINQFFVSFYNASYFIGTSEGFANVRKTRILAVSAEERSRKLPKYDWPEKMVYITPSTHRILHKEGRLSNLSTGGRFSSHSVSVSTIFGLYRFVIFVSVISLAVTVQGEEKLLNKDDTHAVFIRPKPLLIHRAPHGQTKRWN